MPDVVTRNLPEPSVVYAFVIALGFVALVATPAVIALARRLGVLALPGGRRIHSQPVPLLGGVAIVSAVLLAAAPNLPVLNPQLAAILVGAVLMCLVGALDDALHLGAATKLVAQSGCALLPIVEGVTIDHFTIPLVPPVSLGALQYPVTLVFIVAIANTVNLIDGLDGLAAGLGAISALTFAVLAVSLGRNQSAVLAAALAGACLGFLPWNFHPAKVFMGDSGSLPVGFLLATLSIHGVMKTAAALAVIFPIVVMLVPILDTSFVVLKRLKYGRSIMSGDQNHFHHRMLRIGYSQRRAAVLLYLWCGILATFALAVRFLRPHTPGQWHVGPTIALSIFGLIALAVSVYVVYSLEILKYRHLRLIGFARRVDVSGDVPLAARRRAPDGVPTRPTDGIPSGS